MPHRYTGNSNLPSRAKRGLTGYFNSLSENLFEHMAESNITNTVLGKQDLETMLKIGAKNTTKKKSSKPSMQNAKQTNVAEVEESLSQDKQEIAVGGKVLRDGQPKISELLRLQSQTSPYTSRLLAHHPYINLLLE